MNDDVFSLIPDYLLKNLQSQSSVLVNPARVAIMFELYPASGIEFPQMKYDLNLSDGSLASNLKALIKEGLVAARSEKVDSKERTTFIITDKGISTLEGIVQAFREMGRLLEIGTAS